MNGRIVAAGFAAGITVFLWGMVSHMATPLGEIGVQPIPHAENVLPVLGANVPERGLYLFVHWNVVIIAPPLTITREELDEGLEILDDVLAIADEYCVT